MPQCKNAGCSEELTPERCLALLEAGVNPSDFTCVKHSTAVRPFGVMCPSADGITHGQQKVAGKTGHVLVTIDPRNKEAMRKARRFIRRAR